MTQEPKSRPGDANPTPDADAPLRHVNDANMASGQGGYGIDNRTLTHAVVKLLSWLKNRTVNKQHRPR